MGSKTPEEELAEFLASQPSWLRKVLQLQFESLSPDEMLAWNQSDSWWTDGGAKDLEKYREIIRRIPAKWREYRKRWVKGRDALMNLAPGQAGAPRKDALALEAKQLKSQGKSYTQVAIALNHRHGTGTTTPEAVRKLLSSRKPRSTPDKT